MKHPTSRRKVRKKFHSPLTAGFFGYVKSWKMILPPGLRCIIQFFTSISGSQYFGRYDPVMQSNLESSLNFSASSRINEMLSNEFEFSFATSRLLLVMSMPTIFPLGNFSAISLVRMPVPHARSRKELPSEICSSIFLFQYLSFPNVPYETTPSYVVPVLSKNLGTRFYADSANIIYHAPSNLKNNGK